MPIIYNEKTREFHLYNQEISYIIKILDNDQPGQLYYGKRLTHKEDFSHLFEYAMRDMSPYAFEGNSTFSLENIKQEYPTFGCGDMRFPAYCKYSGYRNPAYVFSHGALSPTHRQDRSSHNPCPADPHRRSLQKEV